MIDGSEKHNRQLAFELQNSHVCEKHSNERWTFTSANKQSSWKSILQKSPEKVSFLILICNIGQFTQLLNFCVSFRSFLLWKWNNNYSRVIQCKDFQKKKQQKLANLWRKMCFKNDLSNIQNALITWLMTSRPSFGHEKNYQVEHYFPANFLCRLMKRQLFTALNLVSWRFAHVLYPLKF